jgi:L-seryl-tRNA(Ser) seleniumtransferase
VTTAEVDPRRRVPRTDTVLADPRLQTAAERLGRDVVKRSVAAAQALVRAGELAPEAVADAAVAALPTSLTSTAAVLNATGVVLHTNLGRAPLSSAVVDAVATAAAYADVEFDLTTGRRARRGRGALEALALAVPAAESVLAVNNGAAALVLATTALAAGREVVISRGEMVEIGDGFRLPELIASTGARLREVGTTNRTAAADYAAALGPDTGCILKVHPSNFRVEGFTSAASVAELARLGVPVVVDIGSGLLAPDPLLPDEPDADTTLRAGADLVTASGDKLLGGPQAGLLLGRTAVVERLRRHPLARALRVDKLTLAALEATLRGPRTPTWAALRADPDVLRARVEAMVAALTGDGIPATTVTSDGAVGGGGAPGLTLPGWAVSLPERYAAALRTGQPAVVGRLERGSCLLDLRCVPVEDDARLLAAVRDVPPETGQRDERPEPVG